MLWPQQLHTASFEVRYYYAPSFVALAFAQNYFGSPGFFAVRVSSFKSVFFCFCDDVSSILNDVALNR